MCTLSCERAESFLLSWRETENHAGGSGVECWYFVLAGLQNELAVELTTNIKHVSISSFPENKKQGITGKI